MRQLLQSSVVLREDLESTPKPKPISKDRTVVFDWKYAFSFGLGVFWNTIWRPCGFLRGKIGQQRIVRIGFLGSSRHCFGVVLDPLCVRLRFVFGLVVARADFGNCGVSWKRKLWHIGIDCVLLQQFVQPNAREHKRHWPISCVKRIKRARSARSLF